MKIAIVECVVAVSCTLLATFAVVAYNSNKHSEAPVQRPSTPIVEFVHSYAADRIDMPVWSPVGPTNEASKIMITLYWAGLCDGFKAAKDGGPTNLVELYESMARKMDSTLNANRP